MTHECNIVFQLTSDTEAYDGFDIDTAYEEYMEWLLEIVG